MAPLSKPQCLMALYRVPRGLIEPRGEGTSRFLTVFRVYRVVSSTRVNLLILFVLALTKVTKITSLIQLSFVSSGLQYFQSGWHLWLMIMITKMPMRGT
jgi:hypothetical protein